MLQDMTKAMVMMRKAMDLLEGTHFASDHDRGGLTEEAYDRLGQALSAVDAELDNLDDAILFAIETKR